jgi:hypothetical protein
LYRQSHNCGTHCDLELYYWLRWRGFVCRRMFHSGICRWQKISFGSSVLPPDGAGYQWSRLSSQLLSWGQTGMWPTWSQKHEDWEILKGKWWGEKNGIFFIIMMMPEIQNQKSFFTQFYLLCDDICVELCNNYSYLLWFNGNDCSCQIMSWSCRHTSSCEILLVADAVVFTHLEKAQTENWFQHTLSNGTMWQLSKKMTGGGLEPTTARTIVGISTADPVPVVRG